MNEQATHHRGFTLIEMMVVVALIAILASVALPAFSRFIADQRLSSTAHEIRTLLQSARTEALITRQNLQIAFGPNEVLLKQNGSTLKRVTLDPRLSLQANPAVIDFHPDGSAAPQWGAGTPQSQSQVTLNQETQASHPISLTIARSGQISLKQTQATTIQATAAP